MSDDHPSVLLLATPHFAEEWWNDHREAEIREVVDLLARYDPDVIAVEAMPKDEQKVQEQYERFLGGADVLKVNEIHQIAFRLAQTCGAVGQLS